MTATAVLANRLRQIAHRMPQGSHNQQHLTEAADVLNAVRAYGERMRDAHGMSWCSMHGTSLLALLDGEAVPEEQPKRCTCDGGAYEVSRHPFIVNRTCPIHGTEKIS